MICVSAITIHEYFIFAFNKIDLGTPALSIITCVTGVFSTDCSCAFKPAGVTKRWNNNFHVS